MRSLTGTAAMVRMVLRRDRVRLAVWVLGLAGLLVSSAAAQVSLYDSPAERASYAATIGGNPAVRAMSGPGYGLDSIGGIVAFEIGITGYVAIALMGVLLVVRNTRGEEESGRTELLRATVLGRHAATVATLLVVGSAQLLAGALVTAGLIGLDLPTAGSVALGLSFTVVGWVFAAIAAVAAQVVESGRGASGLGVALLGAAFAVRAAGDVGGGGGASWASPLGWGQALRPYADERWWVLVLPAAAIAVLVTCSVALLDRRDVGAGLVPPRAGPAVASPRMLGPLGLAVRLQRGTVIAWVVGLFVLGVAYGSVGQSAEDLLADNEALADLMVKSGTSITDAFFATITMMTALMAAGFALQATVRPRGEETAGRAEVVLAGSMPRWQWVGGHLVVAVVGSTLALAAAGVGTGVTDGLLAGDAGQVLRLLVASLAYAPATWVLVGVAAALFGVAPRALPLAWAALVGVVVVALLGDTLGLPDWSVRLSPFDHVPRLPGVDLAAGPLLALTAVAAVLLAAGVAGLARRDVG